jgi:hypothetical protein
MPSAKISDAGYRLLEDEGLADAVLLAIIEGDYDPDDENGILVKYKDREIIVYTQSQRRAQDRKNKEK